MERGVGDMEMRFTTVTTGGVGYEGREGSLFGVVCMYVRIEVKYLNTHTFGLDMRARKVDDI